MSKTVLLWIIIGVIVVGALAFFFTRKSASQQSEDVRGTDTQMSETNTNTSSNLQSATPTAEAPAANESCVRRYDPNMFSGKQVDFRNKLVTLSVKGFGNIVIAPNDKDAPKTSENFVKLAQSGFYDCLTFHRVAKDFVIQGGDPEGTGAGGPGYTIPAEIKLLHTKGAVAMARTGDQVNPKRDSSGSQFYIALQALPMLDGAYTVFGQVMQGMDVVEKIGGVEIAGGVDGPPKQPVIIEKVTVTNK